MKYVYAPGCALMSYKPQLSYKLEEFAFRHFGPIETVLTCCFDSPQLDEADCLLTPCETCAQTYQKRYPEKKIINLLQAIAESAVFVFPDYGGASMSIQDTCAARTNPEMLAAVRILLEKMNIRLVEPAHTGAKAKCCGQLLYGKTDIVKVENFMKKRADEMPCEDVVVYCASCIMSMTVGGKRPRYILDLLYGEETDMTGEGVCSWNEKLLQFRKAHK